MADCSRRIQAVDGEPRLDVSTPRRRDQDRLPGADGGRSPARARNSLRPVAEAVQRLGGWGRRTDGAQLQIVSIWAGGIQSRLGPRWSDSMESRGLPSGGDGA